LNRKNKYQLEELGIEGRIGTILEVKKLLTKRSLMQNLERRCQNMQEEINDVMEKFGILQSKGLPSPLVIKDKLMRHIDYVDKLAQYADNQASSSASASAPKALPTGRLRYDSLKNLFYVEHEIKHLFPIQPNFVKYIESDEIFRKLQRTRIPHEKWWTDMTDIL